MDRRKFLGLLCAWTTLTAATHASAKNSGGGAGKSGGSSYRSAKSGQYVKKDYADKHKSTTVKEKRN